MRKIRTSGLMSGEWKRSGVCRHRATPRLYTLAWLLIFVGMFVAVLQRERVFISGERGVWDELAGRRAGQF